MTETNTNTMRALICDAFGPVEQLRYGRLPVPEVGPDQVLIDVAYAGVGMADVLIVQGLHVARPPFPFVPGTEAAGTIRAVGRNVQSFKCGDRVVAFTRRAAIAEVLAVAAVTVFPLPDAVSFRDGAAGLVNYGTAFYALKDRGRLAQGETLLVLGAAGGVGLAAVELGHRLGARVIAAASTADKRDLAKSKGASIVIDYTEGDFRDTLKKLAPEGIDVVFDPVGGKLSVAAQRALARGGRHLIIGFVDGIPNLPPNIYLLKQAELHGVLWGDDVDKRGNTAIVNQWMAEGLLAPEIGGEFSLERGAEAFQAILERRILGKAVIRVRADS